MLFLPRRTRQGTIVPCRLPIGPKEHCATVEKNMVAEMSEVPLMFTSAYRGRSPALCPRCDYRVDYQPVLARCPECGLELGSDLLLLRAKPLYKLVDKLGHCFGFLLLVIVWVMAIGTEEHSMSAFSMVALLLGTTAIFVRLVGFVRFDQKQEYMILNDRAIRWSVQGRRPAEICWPAVIRVHCISWFDWVMLHAAGPRPVRYVPARFRPAEMSVSDFAAVIQDYWYRYNKEG